MSTTIGVKVDLEQRERLHRAAERIGRSPHWLAKQAIIAAVGRIEAGEAWPAAEEAPNGDAGRASGGPSTTVHAFTEFARDVRPQSMLRARITAAYRAPETDVVPSLVAAAALPEGQAAAVAARATELVSRLRAEDRSGPVDGLISEYALSSQEGVALMCLAEALLRIPDRATRDALIRDKIARGDWQSHLGHSRSLFVNAATWGLLVTGKLTATASEAGLSTALTRLLGRGGEPVIRKGVDLAMRMMGEQFVTGQTISEALANARRMEVRGFRYSYDMLGEAATTAEDAARYLAAYEQAVHAIGRASGKRGIYEGPGISIKLSALHPRYARAQRARVMAELGPRLLGLARLARGYDIGLNIDAEEADRLEISLDLLEMLAFDPDLAGWNGVGFVVQAYQKRALPVIEWIIDLARRSQRRIMLRLVKGAYWDSEIKRAQVDGLDGFPVFTRKVHTDVSYLACARRLLAAPDAVFPQFATHNAQTVSAVMAMAGENFYAGQYEFQCLHGMGEPLYEGIVGPGGFNRPCRIYAPVGTHETLLAYLVRRLLENGANTSFVNRVRDPALPPEALAADPVALARAIEPLGAPHPAIAEPRALFGRERPNSAGYDLTDEQRIAALAAALLGGAGTPLAAAPLLAEGPSEGTARPVVNPADHDDVVGHVVEATAEDVGRAFANAAAAAPIWQSTPPAERAAILFRAADLLEGELAGFVGVIVREAGRTIPNAIGETREAADFLRYYGAAVRDGFSGDSHRPLGTVVCISPWNFPLAIFLGQVAAALAAGNVVLAKPAEETPLTAFAAIRLLHAAGVPAGAVQLLPGDGDVGAALVAHPRTAGVIFTGSTEVARRIRASLAGRLDEAGRPLPLIAETGGQNALVVDSSALAEQVVADAVVSAFDSAGQRCSALRLLCLQEEIADRTLAMLRGAVAELTVAPPDRLSTDVGPLISAEARGNVARHIAGMRERAAPVTAAPLPEALARGHFLAPTIIEIGDVAELEREVFGPVLHVLRYRRAGLDDLVAALKATGYGLTFGVHTRIDETVARLVRAAPAGNIYVNRNLIGAVVGVQPFGGRGLSGTGPKAGGPLYLRRLLARAPALDAATLGASTLRPPADAAAAAWRDALADRGRPDLAEAAAALAARGLAGASAELPGPVGEQNRYRLDPRGTVLCLAETAAGVAVAVAAALATGNSAIVAGSATAVAALADLPPEVAARVAIVDDWRAARFEAAVFEGHGDALAAFDRELAARDGPIVQVLAMPMLTDAAAAVALAQDLPLDRLVEETAVSINTTAAGGNASLMAIG